MVDQSEPVASLIVPHHFTDAMKALDSFSAVRNTTLTAHVEKLKSSWNNLALLSENDGRED